MPDPDPNPATPPETKPIDPNGKGLIDPNGTGLSLADITGRNREFSESLSFLRYCSDRELLEEIRIRGYGRPDPA